VTSTHSLAAAPVAGAPRDTAGRGRFPAAAGPSSRGALLARAEIQPEAPVPDLTVCDVIVINSSAGKDSQAMLDRVVEEADRQGVSRKRLVVFHADLGRVEWDGTAELAEEHAHHYGLRFIKIARPQGDLLTQIEQRGMFPDAARRYCTSDHKRGQGRKALTMLVSEAAGDVCGRPVRVLNCMGFRREESPARAKKDALRRDGSASNGRRTVDEWLPILEWTTEQVWDRIRQAGTRHHWAYDAGMPRLSCSFCVLASRGALVRAAQLRPVLAAEYAGVEQRIGHRFRRDLSMAQIVAEAEAAAAVEIEGWTA
jgi:3'-phosphoadenosine 5'-phosphosulfate sulfotransferase (PAPS reductase)/FAD synthetase